MIFNYVVITELIWGRGEGEGEGLYDQIYPTTL
jgi:hypothetical protein